MKIGTALVKEKCNLNKHEICAIVICSVNLVKVRARSRFVMQ
jgi:hypothetical protein